MLKKIAFVAMMLVLPLGVMAQAKFGHLNSQEVITAMPEYTKANSDLEALAKTYQEEMQRTQAEFNKKYEEYVQQADSLPKNIAERRQKELEEMAQRQQQFQQDAQQSLQKAQQEAFQPILKKLNDAIDAAIPVQTVFTLGLICNIVSRIPKPALQLPPGELI